MVLCKFFQQGSCRFGSKCVNDHLDVKQFIKADVDTAVNGKQWPLSTYGPFREKPSVPNFIEDQSFEEVRMLCYEAKQKNYFDQFHQQFNKEALEASNKMKALLLMTPEILDVLIRVYDMPTESSSSGVSVGKTTNNTNNPFGLANSTSPLITQPRQGFAQPSNPVSSIFSSVSNCNPQQNASIFGRGVTTQPNLFASSVQQLTLGNTTGLFSQPTQFAQETHQNSNIFRQTNQVSLSQQGIFAQASQAMQQQPHSNQALYPPAAQETSTSQSIFTQTPQQSQNIFAQGLQQQQPQTNQNIFQQNLLHSAAQQHSVNSNIFQQNQTIMTQQQTQNQHLAPDGFQQPEVQMQNSVVQITQTSQVNSSLYSRLEDLSVDELEAFKDDCFLPGKIPFNPPPRELIN